MPSQSEYCPLRNAVMLLLHGQPAENSIASLPPLGATPVKGSERLPLEGSGWMFLAHSPRERGSAPRPHNLMYPMRNAIAISTTVWLALLKPQELKIPGRAIATKGNCARSGARRLSSSSMHCSTRILVDVPNQLILSRQLPIQLQTLSHVAEHKL
jgi:hypothetical protein